MDKSDGKRFPNCSRSVFFSDVFPFTRYSTDTFSASAIFTATSAGGMEPRELRYPSSVRGDMPVFDASSFTLTSWKSISERRVCLNIESMLSVYFILRINDLSTLRLSYRIKCYTLIVVINFKSETTNSVNHGDLKSRRLSDQNPWPQV